MKTIRGQVSNAFRIAQKKGYDHIVIAIDLHDTIINSKNFNSMVDEGESFKKAINDTISIVAVKALQQMSLRKDIQLMLFSGTKLIILEQVVKILYDDFKIEFEHINNYVSDNPIPLESQNFKEKP